MFRPQIHDDFWYLLGLSGKVLEERSSRPINTRPYPGVQWLTGQELRLSGRDYWVQNTPPAPAQPAQPAIKPVAPTTNIGYDDYLQHTAKAPTATEIEKAWEKAGTQVNERLKDTAWLKDYVPGAPPGSYQGHASDGSSVQKHSCGGLYPYVIFAQETMEGLRYGVIGPTKPNGILVGTYDDAVDFAAALKAGK